MKGEITASLCVNGQELLVQIPEGGDHRIDIPHESSVYLFVKGTRKNLQVTCSMQNHEGETFTSDKRILKNGEVHVISLDPPKTGKERYETGSARVDFQERKPDDGNDPSTWGYGDWGTVSFRYRTTESAPSA
jgi:hypothetical protein